jgi:hypothetical protein
MSISGIANTALSSLLTATQSAQNGGGQGKFQQIQSEFQQLGQDLQAGNLTQAQQDYATLSQNFPNAQTGTTSGTSTTGSTANGANPIAQAFTALAQDLQNGNLSGAQQDYATIQQDFQQQQQGSGAVHHHHHHGGGQEGSQISSALNSLSSALQAGNLSSAQTAFAALQQDLEQFSAGAGTGSTSGSGSTSSQTSGSGLNVTT